jgi:hypothetical protein
MIGASIWHQDRSFQAAYLVFIIDKVGRAVGLVLAGEAPIRNYLDGLEVKAKCACIKAD